jgi:hypothetical protein
MKKGIILVMGTIIFGGTFGVFAQTETSIILPNAEFKGNKVGDTIPANGWKFNYNKDVKGTFIKDASFKGKGPVLELMNPQKEQNITLNSSKFEIKRGGKYRATVWIKAGTEAQKLLKKELSLVLRLIRSDWKKAFHDKAQAITKGWLKYEYEVQIPEDQIHTYFFRIDIVGTGTFYVAGPSVKLVK